MKVHAKDKHQLTEDADIESNVPIKQILKYKAGQLEARKMFGMLL